MAAETGTFSLADAMVIRMVSGTNISLLLLDENMPVYHWALVDLCAHQMMAF